MQGCWNQYLGSCIAGYSFGWMVATKESQTCKQFSAWNPTDSNCMSLQLDQNCSLPYFIPSPLTANLDFPGQPNLGLGKPIDASCAPRKRFLIFDRSGNQTRLFVSPSFSHQNSTIASEVASGVDEQLLVKPVAEEKGGENDEELEDAEEINALLYSDSDDEYDDDTNDDTDSRNDEVSSTRHTLFTIEGCCNRGESLEEEVASSDGSPKRRKLVDGMCKRSTLAQCGGAQTSYDGIGLSEKEEKVRIDEAVKTLGSIIPGVNSKDPLSIIEKAIVYLERMKMEANFPY